MLCIAMFLFSYVNSTMFWHGHNVQGVWFYHSHISGKAHRTGQTDGGHTTAQLILIQTVNEVSVTESVVPVFEMEPVLPAETRTIVTLPAACEGGSVAFLFSRRGPPALV